VFVFKYIVPGIGKRHDFGLWQVGLKTGEEMLVKDEILEPPADQCRTVCE